MLNSKEREFKESAYLYPRWVGDTTLQVNASHLHKREDNYLSGEWDAATWPDRDTWTDQESFQYKYSKVRNESWTPQLQVKVYAVPLSLKESKNRIIQEAIENSRQIKGLGIIKNRLKAIVDNKDAYDNEFLAPTTDALMRAYECVYGSALLIGEDFPKATIAADGDGGLRLEWYRPAREVRLVIAENEDEPSYIYYRQGEESILDEQVSAQTLSGKLRLLLEIW